MNGPLPARFLVAAAGSVVALLPAPALACGPAFSATEAIGLSLGVVGALLGVQWALIHAAGATVLRGAHLGWRVTSGALACGATALGVAFAIAALHVVWLVGLPLFLVETVLVVRLARALIARPLDAVPVA